MSFAQSSRMLAIGTALGEGAMAISAFHGHEEMGRLFEYEAELLSEDANVSFDDMIGSMATVRLETQHNGTRFFNGVVNRFVQLSTSVRYTRYRATLVPWFWLLTRTSNCRIYQTKTVPEIIESIFRERGFEAYENRLTGAYPAREYCVQYRETDFCFVSRLMEEEGIYYYFTHEDGRHSLVLADSSDAHQETAGYATIEYRQQTEGASDGERIRTWIQNRELMPGSFTHADFNFKKPKTIIRPEPVLANREHANSSYELYDYPGEFDDAAQGKRLAELRLQEQQARYKRVHGEGDTRGLSAGACFTLEEHPRDDQNTKFLVVAVSHHAEVSGFEADGGTANDSYEARFVAMPAVEHFRSERSTPRPTIAGPQTAIVVGPAGEEIHTDEFGRVKVKFHWDRYSKADDKSSCWVRVSQSWAGKKWGAIYIPRIGQEVIVEFLEGDPDKPIITGRVYNGECQPPYDLPAQKTKSTLKSNSSKGGEGFNEIRFEDKKGEEQVFIHGQKDLDVRVRNDVRETNYGNRDVRVGWEKDGATGGNLNTLIRLDKNTHVQGGQFEQVDKQLNLVVKEDVVEDFKKNQITKVSETSSLQASEIIVEGAEAIHQKAGKIVIQGAQGVHIKGLKVAIEGTVGVSLSASGSFVSVGPAGVDISGPMVKINSGGSPLSPEAPKKALCASAKEPKVPAVADDDKTGGVSTHNTKALAGPVSSPQAQVKAGTWSGKVASTTGAGPTLGAGAGLSPGGVCSSNDLACPRSCVFMDQEGRRSSANQELQVVAKKEGGGDTIQFVPGEACACSGLLYSVDGSTPLISIQNSFIARPLATHRLRGTLEGIKDFLHMSDLKRLKFYCGKTNAQLFEGELAVYPEDTLSVTWDFTKTLYEFPAIKSMMEGLFSTLSKICDAEISVEDGFKKSMDSLGLFISVDAPSLSLGFEGTWLERMSTKKADIRWQVYKEYTFSIEGTLLKATLKVDLVFLLFYIPQLAPFRGIYTTIIKKLELTDDDGPPFYLSFSCDLKGTIELSRKESEFELSGEVSSETAVAIGALIKKTVLSCEMEASTSVSCKVEPDADDGEFRLSVSAYKFEGVKGKVSFTLDTGWLGEWGYEREQTIFEESKGYWPVEKSKFVIFSD